MNKVEETNEPAAHWGESSPMHDPYVLANFQARSSDVLITTPPKAGTTWMQQILHQLRTGGDDSFSSIDDVVPWLEISREGKSWQQILQHYESIAEPRVFKTHCTAEQTPGKDKARIILTSRDPRDCCVSFYHHMMNMTDEARKRVQVTAPESFELYVEQWLDFAAWYRNVKSWWPYYTKANVLWLRYQDMKNDLPSNVDKIASFLQWTVTPQQKDRVLEFSSFDWMKKNDEKFSNQGSQKQAIFKPGKFIRQGKVGAYRDLMTLEQEQRIMDRARDMLEPECLKFLELN